MGRDALLMQLLEMLDQLSDKVLDLPPNAIAKLRKLETDLAIRPKYSYPASHAEGHVIDAKDQLYNLVHRQRERPLGLHQAAAHTQVDNPGRAGLFTHRQRLDAGKA